MAVEAVSVFSTAEGGGRWSLEQAMAAKATVAANDQRTTAKFCERFMCVSSGEGVGSSKEHLNKSLTSIIDSTISSSYGLGGLEIGLIQTFPNACTWNWHIIAGRTATARHDGLDSNSHPTTGQNSEAPPDV